MMQGSTKQCGTSVIAAPCNLLPGRGMRHLQAEAHGCQAGGARKKDVFKMADLSSALNMCASAQLHGRARYLHHPHRRIIVFFPKHCYSACTINTIPSAWHKLLAFGAILMSIEEYDPQCGIASKSLDRYKK